MLSLECNAQDLPNTPALATDWRVNSKRATQFHLGSERGTEDQEWGGRGRLSIGRGQDQQGRLMLLVVG